jgi:hypothetical protein
LPEALAQLDHRQSRDFGSVQVDSPRLSRVLAQASSIIASQAKCSTALQQAIKYRAKLQVTQPETMPERKSKAISTLQHSHPETG